MWIIDLVQQVGLPGARNRKCIPAFVVHDRWVAAPSKRSLAVILFRYNLNPGTLPFQNVRTSPNGSGTTRRPPQETS